MIGALLRLRQVGVVCVRDARTVSGIERMQTGSCAEARRAAEGGLNKPWLVLRMLNSEEFSADARSPRLFTVVNLEKNKNRSKRRTGTAAGEEKIYLQFKAGMRRGVCLAFGVGGGWWVIRGCCQFVGAASWGFSLCNGFG